MKAVPIEQVDLAFLRLAFPTNNSPDLVLWVEPLKDAMTEFGIGTIREICSFLANMAVESRDLQSMEESFNYSSRGLRATFGDHRITDEQCEKLGRQKGENRVPLTRQKKIANVLYGGEWGRENLGNTCAGDGWTFRGCGPFQITGRANMQAFADAIDMKLDQIPDYIRTRDGACRSAGWFWKSHNMDAKAATPGVKDDRRGINGGLNGYITVRDRFNDLVHEMIRRGC